MAKIIDLGLLIQDPLVFKIKEDDEFTIPGEVNTQFVLQVYKKQEELQNTSDFEAQIGILQDIVLSILKLDKSRKTDLEYVKENLADIRLLKIIMEEMMKHINNIQEDENLESPQSK